MKYVCSLMGLMLAVASSSVLADEVAVPTQIVDVLNKIYGPQPGFRANHAKGVVVEGHFKAAPGAQKLSRAAIFSGQSIPVTVRFSDSGGLPNVPDGSPGANPHGMAIKFHTAKQGDTDMVINSLHVFPVATPEEFRDLLTAISQSPPNAPKPTPFETFVAAHPSVPAAFATVATPDSFADESYYGIDTFFLINRAGKKQAVRYLMTPQKAVHLTPEEASKQPADFLVNELPLRIAKAPVTFKLQAQIAAAEDNLLDATVAWPSERQVVDLGTLTLDKAVADSLAAQKTLLFLPGRVIDGIEMSDDPLLAARNAAYGVSFARRSAPAP